MRLLASAILWIVASAALPAHAVSTSIPPANQPLDGPQATLERLARAYRDLMPEGVGAVLAADYTFHALGDSLIRFVEGSSREREMRAVDGMLRGVIRSGDTLMSPVDSAGMTLDGIQEHVDPEHPDSTQHYRVLTVGRFELGLRHTDGRRIVSAPHVNVFHLVRGDAAVRAPGQPADVKRWYIRRWIEDVAGIRQQLGNQQGGCGENAAPTAGPRSRLASPAGPAALAIRPLTSPACASLEVTCDLPGAEPAHVEVYDVSGRRVNRREVPVAAAGRVTIKAGAGAKLLPGVYWVRLGQAARRPATRMVVVAR